jgi:hypothetical protein
VVCGDGKKRDDFENEEEGEDEENDDLEQVVIQPRAATIPVPAVKSVRVPAPLAPEDAIPFLDRVVRGAAAE